MCEGVVSSTSDAHPFNAESTLSWDSHKHPQHLLSVPWRQNHLVRSPGLGRSLELHERGVVWGRPGVSQSIAGPGKQERLSGAAGEEEGEEEEEVMGGGVGCCSRAALGEVVPELRAGRSGRLCWEKTHPMWDTLRCGWRDPGVCSHLKLQERHELETSM